MRIRSIKPAFWKSETLASIAKEHRLLAIALLNYADDAGYFQAHDALIRGECFPFDEDSTNVRRGLDELSRIAFIALGTAESGQRIGRVVNFSDHQRIDKPSPSKFLGMTVTWDEFDDGSANPPGMIGDPSPTEGKGKEGKGRGAPAGVVVADWVPKPEWDSFVEMRKKIRAPLTDRAKTLALAELEKLRAAGHDPAAVINTAVLNSWKSFYPPREKSAAEAPAWAGAK
jgi:hypothetical protein